MFHVVGVWVQSVGVLALAAWWGNPIGWVAAFLLMGRAFARFSILGHEAAHRLLFSNRKVNDWVGRWLVAYPAFVPLDIYRRGHMAHHKEEFGPNEPDLGLYAGYPITKASWHRKLRRDADGNSGWKNLKGLLLALRSSGARPLALRILGLAGRALRRAVGRPRPLVDLPGVLAAAVDDGVAGAQPAARRGRARRPDGLAGPPADHPPRAPVGRPPGSGWCRSTPGWHLAHHVDIGVPFSKLPQLHRELERGGLRHARRSSGPATGRCGATARPRPTAD